MSAQNRNARLAWIAQELSKGKSNAMIVLDCMSHFKGVSEHTARKDLKDILERLSEIELETLPQVKQRMLEIGFQLLQEARDAMQLGPAASQFRNLAALLGLGSATPGQTAPQDPNAATGAPDAQIVRARMQALMKSKRVRENAELAGVKIDEK